MLSQEEFYGRCDRFNSLFEKALTNIAAIEKLGPELIAPIDAEMNGIAEVECKEGCNYCCFLRVEAISFELVAIYMHLQRTKTKSQIDQLRNKVAKQKSVIEGLSVDEHFKQNIQCPLLESGRCSVYPVRPISCAGHHSCSMKNCEFSFNNPEITGTEAGGIPTTLQVKDARSTQFTVAQQVLTARKYDVSNYELISGLHHLFNRPSSIQKWKSGRKLIKSS